MGETILVTDEDGEQYLVDESDLTSTIDVLTDLLISEDATTIHESRGEYRVEPAYETCMWSRGELTNIRESNFEILDVYDADYGVGIILEYRP